MLVFATLALVIIALAWGVRRTSRAAGVAETPLDILKHRYARGEIAPEQFETMKRQLSES